MAAITFACWPLIEHGPHTGDSLYLNLPWFHFFAEEFLAGTPYPRWLTGMNAGAGSPVFFYYGAVPFYFTTLATALFAESPETVQLGIGQYFIVLASAATFYLFIRHHAAGAIAAAGAVLYALAPYHFAMDILSRQAIGEATSFIWIPLVFLAIGSLAERRSALLLLAGSYGLLVMTHLPTALLCSPFLLCYTLVIYAFRRQPASLARFVLGIVFGLCLAACYLLPALLMQGYVSTEHLWVPYFDYHRWFLLDAVQAPNPTDEAQLLTIATGNSLFFLLAWPLLYIFSKSRDKPLVVSLLLIFSGAWFLMTPLSTPVWHYVPVLQKVQFPWRVMVIQEFAVVSTLTLALGCCLENRRRVLLLFATALTLSVSSWVGYMTFSGYREHLALSVDPALQRGFHSQAVTGREAREYIPITVNSSRRELLEKVSGLDAIVFEDRHGQVEVLAWRNRHILLGMHLEVSTSVEVRQLYFPGWEAAAKGGLLEITPTPEFGLIAFQAPAGQYQVELKLQPLWPEKLGWGLSGAAFLAMLLISAWPRLRRTRRQGD